MITKINSEQTFTGAATTKVLTAFIKSQENLSSTRFIQDTATNWAPKAVFSRSKADFAEMSFLEFLESGIFYFASPLLGEKLFRNGLFKGLQNKNIKDKVVNLIPESVEKIKNNKAISENIKKHTIATKAGIALACASIPIAEYNLSFAKNLFTLKAFKKADFNNIANLNKNQKEDPAKQKRVEENSKKHLKKGALYAGAALASGLLLAKFGHKSNKLQKLSETILEPGQAISRGLNIKNEKAKNFLSEYVKFDFDEEKGKLALSKGQLALTAISGLFGYSKAAEDRGELDKKEVWTRVPLVVLYTIFGSAAFDNGFKKLLAKKNKFPDLIQKAQNGSIKEVPKSADLPKLAETIAKAKNTSSKDELARLTKEKAIITGAPYLFSMVVMGFALSLITRLFTQYRFNKTHNEQDFETKHKEFIKNIDKKVFANFV